MTCPNTERAEAGLNDVAFHVDLTQKRPGFTSETALNALRAEYIERGRGLPINVMFNTTVYHGNFAELSAVVQFFIHHADVVIRGVFVHADVVTGLEAHRVGPRNEPGSQSHANAHQQKNPRTAMPGHRVGNDRTQQHRAGENAQNIGQPDRWNQRECSNQRPSDAADGGERVQRAGDLSD